MALVDQLVAVWPLRSVGDQPDGQGAYPLVPSGSQISLVSDELSVPVGSYLQPLNSRPFRVPTGSWTAAGFVRFDTRTGEHDSFLGTGNPAGNAFQWRVRYYHAVERIMLVYSTNGAATVDIQNTVPITTGSWFFFAAGRNTATNQVFMRVNGTTTNGTLSGATSLFPTTAVFRAGTTVNGGTANNLSLKDLGFWNRALTGAELDSLQAGAVWPFPGGTDVPYTAPPEGRTVAVSGGGATRTVKTLVVDDPTAPNVTPGVYLDGRDGYAVTLNETVRIGRYLQRLFDVDTRQFPDGTIPVQAWWTDEPTVTVSTTAVVANAAELLTNGSGVDPVIVAATPGEQATPDGRVYACSGELDSDDAAVTSTDGDGLTVAVGGAVQVVEGPGQGYVYPGSELIVVGQDSRGQCCFNRDREIVYGPGPDRKIEIAVFLTAPKDMGPLTYGSTVAAEFLAAGVALENSFVWEFEDAASLDAAWASLAGLRAVWVTEFGHWSGDWFGTGDSLFGHNIAAGVGLPLLMSKPWAGEWFERWATFWDGLTGLRFRGRVCVDEADFRFGVDPYDDGQTHLQHLAPYGGMAAAVDLLRADGSNTPITWGMFGLTSFDVGRGYTGWTDTHFSDAMHHYITPNAATFDLIPDQGYSLNAIRQACRWAAKHRDPTRPFWSDYSLVRYDVVMSPDEELEIINYGVPVYAIGGQMWVLIRYGATCLRGYFFDPHAAEANRQNIAVGAQSGVGLRPGDPGYYEWLHHCTKIHEYEQYLLGAEADRPFPGPWWEACHRYTGGVGHIWFAVNVLPRSQFLHPNAVPQSVPWGTAEVIDGDESTAVTVAQVTAGLTIPAGGVVVLTTPPDAGRQFVSTGRRGAVFQASGAGRRSFASAGRGPVQLSGG